MMRNAIEREYRRDQFGWQERLHGRMDEAFINEGALMNDGAETHLLQLLKYYLSLVDGRPPWVRRFRPETDLPELGGMVSYIDVAPESPTEFILLGHQPSPFPGIGQELSGRRVLDHPLMFNAISCVGEYKRSRDAARPEYALIDQSLRSDATDLAAFRVRRTFYRLLLPLADLDGRIIKLAYSFRRIAVTPPGTLQLAHHPLK